MLLIAEKLVNPPITPTIGSPCINFAVSKEVAICFDVSFNKVSKQ